MVLIRRLKWPFIGGLAGIAGLFLIYFSILSLAESPSYAISLLLQDIWVVLPLMLGFGIQVALYIVLKMGLYVPVDHVGSAGVLTGAGGTTSALSMVACCAHRVTDVLPFLGLTAASAFLAQYKTAFMVVALISNLIGITVMANILYRARQKALGRELKSNIIEKVSQSKPLLIASVLVFVLLAGISYVLVKNDNDIADGEMIVAGQLTETVTPFPAEAFANENLWQKLESRKDEQGAVIVEILTSRQYSSRNELVFEISLNTHSVDLAIDLSALSSLTTPNGLNLNAKSWEIMEGSGHHLVGELTFSFSEEEWGMLNSTDELIVSIINLDAPLREFAWLQ